MHIPVLLNEVIEYLDPKPNENFVDCTVGQGGHAMAILEKTAPSGKVLGIDLDKDKIASIKNDRLILVNNNFANLKNILESNSFKQVDGILLDLGFSSEQLEGRGLSFLRDEPLDMRLGQDIELTAKQIVNDWSEQEIEKIIREYGEEKFSKKIAKLIVQSRPLATTTELASVIAKVVKFSKINPATRTFQALRIAVNGELDNLEKVLPDALLALKTGGRLAVISFHSLEDRIVKNFFKDKAKENLLKILTNKPITATSLELSQNPRSRSAKLRVATKI